MIDQNPELHRTPVDRPSEPAVANDPAPHSARTTRPRRRRTPRAVLAAVLTAGLVGGVVGGTAAQGYLPGRAAAQLATPAVNANLNTASALQSALVSVAQSVGPAVVSVRTDQGLGSGVIYDASGLILTNAHVIDGAQSITIGLADGRHFTGTVKGQDPGFDVAVIKIDGQNLPTAPLGNSSQLQVGEFVLAIGNPYGFDNTVTTGVVSAVDRPISEGQGSYNQPMIQTDAAINPGNSGGPLVDLQGRVVGINTLIAAPQGMPAQGLGFAVPSDTVQRIAPQLVQDGKVTSSGQPYLGLSLGDLNRPSTAPNTPPFGTPGQGRRTPRIAPTAPAGVDRGALVGQVAAGGPAEQAGLQAGDVITTFDGAEIYNPDELLQRLVLRKPGEQVPVTVVRNGQTQALTLTVGEAPAQ